MCTNLMNGGPGYKLIMDNECSSDNVMVYSQYATSTNTMSCSAWMGTCMYMAHMVLEHVGQEGVSGSAQLFAYKT